MSFTNILSSLNKPPVVAATGVVIAVGFPFVPALSVGVLQAANVLAFATSVAAVSVPGRIDSNQDQKMRQGDLNPPPTPTPTSASLLLEEHRQDDEESSPLVLRDRTLVRPAGWAFAIWGPIYVGEAAFCAAQFVDAANITSVLPQASVPFIAANLMQSLWCASFRQSYDEGWHKYVSCAMLGGTAYALSYIPADQSWFFLPMVMHFGWTTAATLVNLNGSLAMTREVSDSTLVAVGHASAVAATAVGVGVTVLEWSTPVYGLTLAWALAAVANGVKLEAHKEQADWSEVLQSGARVQQALCWAGSALCVAAAAFTYVM